MHKLYYYTLICRNYTIVLDHAQIILLYLVMYKLYYCTGLCTNYTIILCYVQIILLY